jgi:hypothetical protein
MFTTGLPLEPGEMGAEIWISRLPPDTGRIAETSPSVIVCASWG